MDETAFAKYLKKAGKQPHVVTGLLDWVRQFELLLAARPGCGGLETAREEDIQDYAVTLDELRLGASKNALRALALYYRFTGNASLAQAASGLRRQAIGKDRPAFPLREFLGVDAAHVQALERSGVTSARQMLALGATPQGREDLSRRAGIPQAAVLELVRLSDLARLDGVKGIRARLYHDAGFDSIEKLAACEEQVLLARTAEFVLRTGFPGIAPLPMEVRHTIQAARRLPRAVFE